MTLRRFLCFCVGFMAFSLEWVLAQPKVTSQDLALIRNHLTQQIWEIQPDAKQIQLWETEQNPDGSFQDLDYLKSDSSEWGVATTLDRALTMIKVTQAAGNSFFGNTALQARATHAIQFVARGTAWTFNWWTREIQLPLITYKILFLFEEKLDPISKNYLMNATNQGNLFSHPSGWATEGENLIWYSEITLALGVLYQNPSWVEDTIRALSRQIKLGQAEGVQSDYSFHQHGPLFYSGGYGLSFATDTARLFQVLAGSSFGFSTENYETMSHFILDGELYLIHGKTFEESGMGRTYARENGADPSSLQTACLRMADVPGDRQTDFKSCASLLQSPTQNGNANGKLGTQYFWKSDFFTHNQPGFGISLRLNSSRTVNGDSSPQGEGLKSEYLADGLTYFYRSGQEYWNIYPVWNFLHLPGTTEEYEAHYPQVSNDNYVPHPGAKSFVGGLTHGEGGIAAFDFVHGKLKAKKSWFFFKSGVVALGSDIACSGCKKVQTTLNQEWSMGDVQYGLQKSNIPVHTLSSGEVNSSDVSWAYANGMGYLFLSPAVVTLQNSDQTGSWKSLASLLSPALITGKVTSLWVDHDTSTLGNYAYAVFPQASLNSIQGSAIAPGFKIIQNTAAAQAVDFSSAGDNHPKVQAVFFQPGSLAWEDGTNLIQVNQPLLVEIEKTNAGIEVSVADPTQRLESVLVHFRWQGIEKTESIRLPSGNAAGMTATHW